MKKLLVIILVSLGFSFITNAQNKVLVAVTGLKNNKGVVRACLFNNAASFEGSSKPFQCLQVTINNKTAQAIFENVPAGTYAVSVFHDANNNNEMDTNFMGVPTEGYGASKNKLPFAAAPKYKDNQFIVANNTTTNLTIKLRHIGL